MHHNFNFSQRFPNFHACNCIGCCKECGCCRTTPTHAKTCADIKALNEERERIFREANS